MTPKRSLFSTALTTAALVLLLSFKTPSSTGLPVSGSVAPTGAPLEVAALPSPGYSASASGLPNPSSASPTSSPVVAASDGTFTGATVSTNFGPVQVGITIAGGKLVDVRALQLPSDRTRSADIAAYSSPILRSEALSAQSAQIDVVSGATYTSEGYAQSLQSALDAAHAA
jgi:uncharacterized protein with FMN-binding domain